MPVILHLFGHEKEERKIYDWMETMYREGAITEQRQTNVC